MSEHKRKSSSKPKGATKSTATGAAKSTAKSTPKSTVATRFLRGVVVTVCALVVGFALYFFNAQYVVGNQLPMPFGYGVSVVLSGSMEPQISAGDAVIVKELDATQDSDAIAVGDVIVYQSGDSLVVHRVVSVTGDQIITQGDANNAPDSPIAPSAVKARVTACIPYAGYLLEVLKSPIFVLLVIGFAVWALERSFKSERQEADDDLALLRAEVNELKESLSGASAGVSGECDAAAAASDLDAASECASGGDPAPSGDPAATSTPNDAHE